jgi:hypothetical protein
MQSSPASSTPIEGGGSARLSPSPSASLCPAPSPAPNIYEMKEWPSGLRLKLGDIPYLPRVGQPWDRSTPSFHKRAHRNPLKAAATPGTG